MSVAGHVQNHLRGTLEIFLLRPGAVARFSPSFVAMLLSFLIPVLVLPLSYFFDQMMVRAIERLEMQTPVQFVFAVAVQVAVTVVAVYLFCRIEQKGRHFFRAVTIGNWMTLATILPFLVMLAVYTWLQGDVALFASGLFFLCFTVYTMLCSAMVLKTLLQISWLRAVFYLLSVIILVFVMQRGLLSLFSF